MDIFYLFVSFFSLSLLYILYYKPILYFHSTEGKQNAKSTTYMCPKQNKNSKKKNNINH